MINRSQRKYKQLDLNNTDDYLMHDMNVYRIKSKDDIDTTFL